MSFLGWSWEIMVIASYKLQFLANAAYVPSVLLFSQLQLRQTAKKPQKAGFLILKSLFLSSIFNVNDFVCFLQAFSWSLKELIPMAVFSLAAAAMALAQRWIWSSLLCSSYPELFIKVKYAFTLDPSQRSFITKSNEHVNLQENCIQQYLYWLYVY